MITALVNCRYPAEFLGLSHEIGRVAPGYRANLVLVDERLRALNTWIDGSPAHRAGDWKPAAR